MAIDLRDIPETAHLFDPKREAAYRGLALGAGQDAATQAANRAILQAAIDSAVGGRLDLPAGATLEVSAGLVIPGDLHLSGHGATLHYTGPPAAGSALLRQTVTDARLTVHDLTIQGTPEAALGATPNVSGLQLSARSTVDISGLRLRDWFNVALAGAVGVTVWLERSTLHGWHQGIAGGDGALAYRLRDCTFGRTGDGASTSHQMYINPDVFLDIQDCDFLNAEGDPGWAIHYYGSDVTGPYQTPTYTRCYFERAALTNEHGLTVVRDCTFNGASLQVQNDTLAVGCQFVGGGLNYRTGRAALVTLRDCRVVGATLNGEVDHPGGAVYRLENSHLTDARIDKLLPRPNTLVIQGGRWDSGQLDWRDAPVYLDGALLMSTGIPIDSGATGTVTRGTVIDINEA